jgi:hypothetical protein
MFMMYRVVGNREYRKECFTSSQFIMNTQRQDARLSTRFLKTGHFLENSGFSLSVSKKGEWIFLVGFKNFLKMGNVLGQLAYGHLGSSGFPEFCMLKNNLGPRYLIPLERSLSELQDGKGYGAHAAIL